MKRKKPATPTSNASGRPGHPPYVPTQDHRALVETLTGYGIPQDDIAKLIINPTTGKPIDGKTLRAYYRHELDVGTTKANAKVAGALFKNAVTPTERYPGGNPVCQIFWLKTRAGYRTVDKDPILPLPMTEGSGLEDEVPMIERARRIAFALELSARQPIEGTAKKVDA